MTKLKLVSREYDAFASAFGKQADTFSAKNPDISIEREFNEIHAHYDKMIGGDGCSSGEYDLFLCVTDWVPEAIDKGLLTPLDEFIANDPPQDWPSGWSPSMIGAQTGPDGKIYGIPYHDGPEMLLYRTDLFEDPKEQEAFKAQYGYPLQLPETWNQFVDVAKFFTRPDQGLWGISLASFKDGHNNVYDFLIHLWSRGGQLFDQNWKPQFHGDIGKEALQFLLDLYEKHKVVSQECLELDSVKCGFHFAAGNAAMMWNWCGFAALTEIPEYSKIVGKTKCAVVPRGDGPNGQHYSLNIYWVLTIPSASKHKAEAYRFLRHIASPEMDKITSMEGANGVRLSTWRDPEVQKKFQYYEIIEKVHQKVQSPPQIPEYPAINEVLSEMVDSVLNGRSTVEAALNDAAKEIETILTDAGYYS